MTHCAGAPAARGRWRMILHGDCLEKLKTLADSSVDCVVTSPPYWGLRDYGVPGQLGLEATPEEYVARMVEVFREVRRVLKPEGTLWLNLGDSYGKVKQLVGIPWRVAFALQADGWYLRQDIIWHKPNPMPESVRDRCTKAHEYIFLLSKSEKYFYDAAAVKEPQSALTLKTHGARGGTQTRSSGKYSDGSGREDGGYKGVSRNINADGLRNRRSVWTVTPKPFKGAHFATFPPDLIEPCILAGCPKDGVVLDPFFGAGTTGIVAQRHERKWIGIELNAEYVAIAQARIKAVS